LQVLGVSDRDRQRDDETDEGASLPPPSQPRRPPSPFYRRRTSSITITEPVGLFAPLLAMPPATQPDDEEPALDRLTLSPSSVDPVTVAQTQSVEIPLGDPADRSAGLRRRATTLALGAAGALFLTVVVLVSAAPGLRHRSASVAPPPPEPTARSFVAPLPIPVPAPPAAVAPGAGSALAVSAAASPSRKSKAGSQTLVLLPRSSTGHRIFVDGRTVGSGPEPVTVKCGRHSIKIGSAGKPRIKDLPCGGEIALGPNQETIAGRRPEP
jgi:hypothetical protein